MKRPVRALVVDDSAFMRHTISKLLTAEPGIEVVDTARDGIDALEKIERLDVDVLTLDIEMPRMDGLTALRHLMRQRALPVVMVSSSTREGANATIRALTLGAVDFVCKPAGAMSLNMEMVGEELRSKVRQAARTTFSRLRQRRNRAMMATPAFGKPSHRVVRVVAIGSSTGGPKALHELLPRISKDFPAPIVVVQHMPSGFTRSLAEHLDKVSMITVREARHGDTLRAGEALVVPGDYHLTVRSTGVVELNQEPAVHGVRPSVDVTFQSLAGAYGSSCLAVVLTGMGCDGAQGALSIRRAGGQVIAEDKSTCVVYGMSRCACENGAVERVFPLPQMAAAIQQIVSIPRAI